MLKLQIIGHVGRDAEVREYSGQSVVNFSVAHTERFKKDGETKEQTHWVKCAYWSKNTKIAEYLKSGTLIFAEGFPTLREWERNGRRGVEQELRVEKINLLSGSKKETQAEDMPGQQPSPAPAATVDDLPF